MSDDINGDGVPELLIGSRFDDTGGTNRGATYLMFLRPNGTASDFEKWGSGTIPSSVQLNNNDRFGSSVSSLGDFNGDGVPDVFIGADGNDGRGTDRGAVYVGFVQNDGTLPVELAGFQARLLNEQVILTWETISETSNAGFQIERRSSSATTWSSVGFVDGAGYTTERKQYRFLDKKIPYDADRVSYRLRQVDTDGTETLSKSVSIQRLSDFDLQSVAPNPAHGTAVLRYTVPRGEEMSLELYDILGRRIRTVSTGLGKGRTETRLSTDGLASGTYLLRLISGQQITTQRFSVVR